MRSLISILDLSVEELQQLIHTAEDIAIMVFSDLVVNKHRYNFKVSFKTYLFID